MQLRGLEQVGVQIPEHYREMASWSCCDIGNGPLLHARHDRHQSVHEFVDIEKQMPARWYKRYKDMIPDYERDTDEHIRCQHDKIKEMLISNRTKMES